jgi:hypothetical protein
MVPTLGIREGETVYDFAWFPSMNAQGKVVFILRDGILKNNP